MRFRPCRGLREGLIRPRRETFQTSLKVVVPAAFSGIVASLVLGASRAIGETMVVLLAAGQRAKLHARPAPARRNDGDFHRRDR